MQHYIKTNKINVCSDVTGDIRLNFDAEILAFDWISTELFGTVGCFVMEAHQIFRCIQV